jgi:gamma-glutamylcyclotransferase (GGCT)/AIG2-like uncharacterized protein YtfP
MAPWLSDLVRDGALNEIVAELNRSADRGGGGRIVDRAESLLRVLHELANLFRGAGLMALLTKALSPEEQRTLLKSAGVGRLAGEGATVEKLASLLSTLQRDEAVRRRVLSVQERVVHLVLGRPDHKLAAYGTLVPGERNHRRVAHLGGTWRRCLVRGRRWTAEDGDPRFRWHPGEPELDAMLLVSDQLPAAWRELDRFEGSPYRRCLVPVRVPAGGEDEHQVAYLYESADQTISK